MKANLATIANLIRTTLHPLPVVERCEVLAFVLSTAGTPASDGEAALSSERREDVVRALAGAETLNQAAARLGCSRRTLNNRMRQYGLPPGIPGARRRAHLTD